MHATKNGATSPPIVDMGKKKKKEKTIEKRKFKKIYYIANNFKKMIVLYREETEVNLSVNYVWMCMDLNVILSHQHAPLRATDCFQMGLPLFPLSVYAKSFAHCVYFLLLRFLFLERFFFPPSVLFLQLLGVADLLFSFSSVNQFSVLYKVFCTFPTNSIAMTTSCAISQSSQCS